MIGTRFGGSWCAKRLFAVSLYVLFLVVFPASKPTFLRKCRVPARWPQADAYGLEYWESPKLDRVIFGRVSVCIAPLPQRALGTGWVRVHSRRAMNKPCYQPNSTPIYLERVRRQALSNHGHCHAQNALKRTVLSSCNSTRRQIER